MVYLTNLGLHEDRLRQNRIPWLIIIFLIKRAILLHTLYCSCLYPHIPSMVREHPQHHIPAALPSKSHDINVNPMKSPHDFPMVIWSFFWVRWSKGHQLHSFHRRRGRLGHCTGAGASHGILPANTHGRRPWRRGPKIVDFWWEKCVMFDEIIVLWVINIIEHTGKKIIIEAASC